MKNNIIVAIIALFTSFSVMAQMAVNTSGSVANASAMLDVSSTSKGILVPRMTAAQRGLISSPATGLMVFQTDSPTGYYYYNGAGWKQVVNLDASIAFPPANTLITSDGTNWVTKTAITGTAGANAAFDNMQPYLTLNYCIATVGIFPSRSGQNPFIGEVELFGFNFAPVGWAMCNGQLLQISTNQALYALLGNTYGGNGTTNFALPDLRGRMPINQGQGPGLQDRIIGESGGASNITILTSQMPAHSHPVILQ